MLTKNARKVNGFVGAIKKSAGEIFVTGKKTQSKRLTFCSVLHIIRINGCGERNAAAQGGAMEERGGKGSTEEKNGRRKDAGVYFKKITERIQAYANKRGFLRDERGLLRSVTYAQGKVLFYLHQQDGGEATMKRIETYLDVSHATVSGIVSRLKEKGYVACEKSKDDARAKTVRLTEKEHASFDEMRKRRAEMETMLLKNFSDEERAALFYYLERIYKNVCEAAEDDMAEEERRSCDEEKEK